MNRKIIRQGDAVSFAFFNVVVPLNDSEKYKITEKDKVIFSIARENRKPVITKEFPRDFHKEVKNTFVVTLSPQETKDLPCLLYQMKLTLDVENMGEEIYTLINQELEVIAK